MMRPDNDLASLADRVFLGEVGGELWVSNRYFAHVVGKACRSLFGAADVVLAPGVYDLDRDGMPVLAEGHEPPDMAACIPSGGDLVGPCQLRGYPILVRPPSGGAGRVSVLVQAWQAGERLVAVQDIYMRHVLSQTNSDWWTQEGPDLTLCGWADGRAVALVMPYKVEGWDDDAPR